MRPLIPNLLAALGGLLLPLAFSPFDWAWLAPVAIALLFATWLNANPRQALMRGYCFGLGQFGFGVSWVYISIHQYGGANAVEAIGLTALMVAYLALYPALAGWLAVRLFGDTTKPRKLLLAFPACWVLVEWFRGWFFLDFSWLQLGISHVGTALGLGLAPIAGVYGVGFAVAVLGGLCLAVFDGDDWRRRGAMIGIGLLLVTCAWLDHIEWTHPAGLAFNAALLQGNIAQGQKWQPELQQATLQRYVDMSRAHWDAQLIIWPETAIPAFYHQVQDTWLAELQAEASLHHTDFLIGIPWLDPETQQYYNSMISVTETPQIYRKRHLVPFGEYLPYRPVFGWILDLLQIPLPDFAQGPSGQIPLQAAGYPLAASICYEDTLGHEARDALPKAKYLVNITNDAWFGDSIAPYQHAQIARMRALESGRWLLRATNTGLTAAISPEGEIISQAPLFQQTAITASIIPMAGVTPYLWLGDWGIISGLFALLVLLKLNLSKIPPRNTSDY